MVIAVMVTVGHLATGSFGSNLTDDLIRVMKSGKGTQLEFMRTSPTAGFIQTPGCCHISLQAEMNSMVRVLVPTNQTAMITMLRQKFFSKVKLIVYENDMTASNVVSQYRLREVLQRKFLSEGADIFVHFQYKGTAECNFRLLFSVHEESAMLEQEADETWNCSVSAFQDFRPHFPCDLQPQCFNAEDERDCPYFSEDCGSGYVTLADHCLVYVGSKPQAKSTWRDKEIMCKQLGMEMASFKRREDYERLRLYLDPLAGISNRRTKIAIGIHTASESLPLMYRHEMQNSDGTVAFYTSLVVNERIESICGFLDMKDGFQIRGRKCTGDIRLRGNSVLCEMLKASSVKEISSEKIRLPSLSDFNHSHLPLLIGCPRGHVSRDFLVCDFHSTCWSRDALCLAPLSPIPPLFTCANGVERISYSMICDIQPDCSDDSDETFCVYPPCDLPVPFYCTDHQCVPWSAVCDGQKDCLNAVDEDLCFEGFKGTLDRPASPAVVHLSRHGRFTVHKMTQLQLAELSPAVCPGTHFQCPDDGYCMPVFLRCNGVYDCPGKEDEANCNKYTCPGFYRCRASRACLHPRYLCDTIFQCPQNDDELLCHLRCPENCTCYGLAWYCRQRFHSRANNQLRFLDVRGSGMRVSDFVENVMLIYLSVAENSLTSLSEMKFPNLRELDLSNNQLTTIQLQDLRYLPQLNTMSVSGNPLLSILQCEDIAASDESNVISSLQTLDLSRVKMDVLNTSFLVLLPNLHTINVSGSGVDTLLGEGFQALTRIRTLDFRGCPLTQFPRQAFQGLEELEVVHSDNYKLCCPATLPVDFPLKNCHAPSAKISGCEALLGSDSYRVVMSVFAVVALLGNSINFLRLVFVHKKQMSCFNVFVVHLSLANLLMGIYLSVIVVADRLYVGTYLWEEDRWTNSEVCKVAGFLSEVSGEVSALILAVFTIDRVLVLRFPFSRFHFDVRSAQVASLCAWSVGCLMAVVPLVTTRQIYGQTGICAPLPGDIAHYPVVLGMIASSHSVFFMMIVAGQAYIYWSVRAIDVLFSDRTRRSQDLTIARRLMTVAVTDILYWFAVSLVGLLATTGNVISEDINAAIAIFVRPVNPALNPLLYRISLVLENLRIADEDRVKRRLMAQFRHMGSATCTTQKTDIS